MVDAKAHEQSPEKNKKTTTNDSPPQTPDRGNDASPSLRIPSLGPQRTPDRSPRPRKDKVARDRDRGEKERIDRADRNRGGRWGARGERNTSNNRDGKQRHRDRVERGGGKIKDVHHPSTDNKARHANTVPHPLENKWNFWFDSSSTRKQGDEVAWDSNLKEIGVVDTIESFWGMFNHLELPSRLDPGDSYSLFLNGVKPMWEDEKNQGGGKWIIRAGHNRRFPTDSVWEKMVLSVVGETLSDSDCVNGVVLSRRRLGDRLAVWLKHGEDNEESMREMESRIRSVLSEEGSRGRDYNKSGYFMKWCNHQDTITRVQDRISKGRSRTNSEVTTDDEGRRSRTGSERE